MNKNKTDQICLLSGLPIPKDRFSWEHLIPKSRGYALINSPSNVFPAHKIINSMKGDLLPCEFEQLKYEMAYNAIEKWNIKESDRNFIRQAIINWKDGYNPDWCSICLLNCKRRQR